VVIPMVGFVGALNLSSMVPERLSSKIKGQLPQNIMWQGPLNRKMRTRFCSKMGSRRLASNQQKIRIRIDSSKRPRRKSLLAEEPRLRDPQDGVP
jgi:hypothetical protein